MQKKLSEIAKIMAESILVKNASIEAISVALQLVHIAWNFADEDYENEEGYTYGLQEIQKIITPIYSKFIIQDCEKLIKKLMDYKKKHFRNDGRIILFCKFEKGIVKITWK